MEALDTKQFKAEMLQAKIGAWGWKRIAKLWDANKPGSIARKAIVAECHRLGYTPHVILSIHRGGFSS